MKRNLNNHNKKYIFVYLLIVILFMFISDFAVCSENFEYFEENGETNDSLKIESNEISHDETKDDKNITEISDNIKEDIVMSNSVIDRTLNITNSDISVNVIDKIHNIAENTDFTLHDDSSIQENSFINENEKIDDNILNNTTDISEVEIFRDIGVIDEDNEILIKEAENIDEKATTSTESEWEKEISNFEPAEMLTIELDNQKEFLYDPISEIPSHIKLAFIVNDEDSNIGFNIIDPSQKVIYSVDSVDHLFYDFIADKQGEYIFVLDSRGKKKNKIKVTFAIHQGNSTNTHLSHENLQSIWDKINLIYKSLKSSRFSASLLSKKYDSHFEYAQKHNRHITFMSLVETSFLILIFFFQLFYIKRLASKIN